MRNHSTIQRAVAVTVTCLFAAADLPVSAQDPYVPPDLIRTETQTITTVVEALIRFDDRASELEKMATLSKADLEALASDANVLKAKVSTLQQALSGSIRKLRDAGKWTPLLDTFVEQNARSNRVDDSIIQALKTLGGFRNILEQSAASSTLISTEIDKRLADLRGRTTAQRLFDFFLGTPVEARVSRRTACRMLVAGAVASIVIGGTMMSSISYQYARLDCGRHLF